MTADRIHGLTDGSYSKPSVSLSYLVRLVAPTTPMVAASSIIASCPKIPIKYVTWYMRNQTPFPFLHHCEECTIRQHLLICTVSVTTCSFRFYRYIFNCERCLSDYKIHFPFLFITGYIALYKPVLFTLKSTSSISVLSGLAALCGLYLIYRSDFHPRICGLITPLVISCTYNTILNSTFSIPDRND